MRKVLTFLVLVFSCLSASAATSTFAVSGLSTLLGNSPPHPPLSISGTVVIDVTTGYVVSVDVALGNLTFQFWCQRVLDGATIIQALDQSSSKILILEIQTSLVGYAGGNLCSRDNTCGSFGMQSEVYCLDCPSYHT